MIVMVLDRVPPGLRGQLTRWLLEPKSGVFVGRVSALVRDKLWDLACERSKGGAVVMIHTTNNEQGFAFREWGAPGRTIRDFDGLSLVTVPQERR